MKNYLLIIFAFSSAILFAQEDTVKVEYGTEVGSLEEQEFIDAYNDLFLLDQKERFLLKIDLLGLARQLTNNRSKLSLGLEQKIGKAASINLRAIAEGAVLSPQKLISTNYLAYLSFAFEIEPRWFIGMSRKIRTGKGADNLSGNYIGLFYRLETIPYGFIADGPDYTIFNNYGGLKFGMQRRIFNRWFFDFSVGLGLQSVESLNYDGQGNYLSSNIDIDPHLHYDLGIGLAFGGAKKGDGSSNCTIFRCFEEEKSLWKVNLIDLVRHIGIEGVEGRANIAYEQKLGESSFSINTEADASYEFYPGIGTREFIFAEDTATVNLGYKIGTVGLETGIRYYYNQKKKIASGESGNNLSGNYYGLRTRLDRSSEAVSLSIMPTFGMQRRLFKNGYLNFEIGIGRETEGPNFSQLFNDFSIDVDVGFAIGLAF